MTFRLLSTPTVPSRGLFWFLEGADVWLVGGQWMSRYPKQAPRMLLNGVRTA